MWGGEEVLELYRIALMSRAFSAKSGFSASIPLTYGV